MNKFSVKILVLTLPLLFGTAKLGAQVSIGANKAPKPFSVLELVSQYKTDTYGGLRLPQMTTGQRDDLGDFTDVSDAYGLMIYNTSVNCVEYWNNKKWASLCTGRADIALDGDCATDHLFAADGSEACTFTPEDHPPCVVTSGATYQIYLTAGSAYTTLQVDDFTSAFTLTFSPNNSSNPRIAVVRVVNNCSGEYQDFPFYQDGAECPSGVSIFNLKTSPVSAELCGDNGAVIAWVESPDPGIDYVWEYGGTIVHTGAYMQITYPGKYTVYAGLLGCELTPSQFITVTKDGGGSSSGAPTVTATNNGILCAGGNVILTAGNITAGNTVQWFHNDSLCTTCLTNPLTLSGAAVAGEWFASQQDGSGCGSKMSAIINLHDQTTSVVALDPPLAKVNGEDLDGDPTICKGGTIELEVTNSYPAGTVYEWFDGTTSIYKGTDPIIYPVAPDKNTMTLSVQVSNNSGGCPNTATSASIPVDVVAPAATSISATAICGSAPAVLSALNASGEEYEWFLNGTKVATTSGPTGSIYNTTVPGSYTVRYQNISGCWSLLSVAVTVVQSAAISLSWQTAPPLTAIVGSSGTYTVLASPPADSYSWSILPSGLATITQIPPGNSATVDYLVIDDPGVIISVTATNACGTTDSLKAPVEIMDDCSPISGVSINPPGPIARTLDGSGQPKAGQETTIFTAMGAASAINYEWFEGVTSKQSGPSATYSYPTPTSPGSYTVSVEASNSCSDKTASVTVNVTQDNPSDISGNYRINGKTCYDVYVTDWSPSNFNACMPKDSRTDDFAGGYTFVYNFFSSIPAPTGFSGLTWEIDDPESLVANITPSGTYNENLTIIFKSDPVNGVKKKAELTDKTTALKVTITAKYTDNIFLEKQVSLEISIQDCACGCPVKKSATEWLTFMCYNIGADPNMSVAQQIDYNSQASGATSTDETVYGWIYQWGRKADGHQRRGPQNNYPTNDNVNECGTVIGTENFDANGQIISTHDAYAKFIKVYNCNNYDWRSPQEHNLWNHATTLGQNNNPCPAGWRVPTQPEWVAVMANNHVTHSTTTTTKTRGVEIRPSGASGPITLFLPAAGYRYNSNGLLNHAGTVGCYWSSSILVYYAYYLSFYAGTATPSNYVSKAYGVSLRCVAAN